MTDRTDRTAEEDALVEIAEPATNDDPTGVEEIDRGEPLIPADSPTAVQAFGTTAEEQRRGESLDRRLAEEEPDTGERPRHGHDVADEETDVDAEDAAMRVVEGPDLLPGAVDDPVDHYVEEADGEEEPDQR